MRKAQTVVSEISLRMKDQLNPTVDSLREIPPRVTGIQRSKTTRK